MFNLAASGAHDSCSSQISLHEHPHYKSASLRLFFEGCLLCISKTLAGVLSVTRLSKLFVLELLLLGGATAVRMHRLDASCTVLTLEMSLHQVSLQGEVTVHATPCSSSAVVHMFACDIHAAAAEEEEEEEGE